MKSPLQQITTRAKQLRKKNKSLQWKDAIKKASAEYNRGGAAKKKPVAKKRSKVQKLKVFKAKKARAVRLPAAAGAGTAERNRIESEIKRELQIVFHLRKAGRTVETRRMIRAHKLHIKNLRRSLRDHNSHISRLLR